MTDHAIDHATPRLGSIDRYSPAVLLSLALLFGLLAQALFYRSALGINVGISAIVILAAAYRLRPSGTPIDRLDRWIAPSAVVFGLLPALRVDLMLLLFDVPAAFVLVTMAVVSFSGVPLTRRAADILVILGLVVVGRIVAGGALLLAAFRILVGPSRDGVGDGSRPSGSASHSPSRSSSYSRFSSRVRTPSSRARSATFSTSANGRSAS